MKESSSTLQLTEPPMPDYVKPDQRSVMGKRNDLSYERNRLELQAELDKHKLPDALQLLQQQQMDIGFICDDLSQVRYFQCPGPGDSFFIGQFNPRRADRMRGAGRSDPPRGVLTNRTMLSPKCFLCTDNVRWQSRGIQLYYQFRVGESQRIFNALCNPFPFMPTHLTIASVEHKPQSWQKYNGQAADKVTELVQDLYDIALMMPGYVGFYNGVGAGATIEEHFHYQFFQIPKGHGLFPLQQIASTVEKRTKSAAWQTNESIPVLVIEPRDYPLTSFRYWGERQHIIQSAVERIKKWESVAEDSASANLTAIWEGQNLVMYLIPRNRFYSKSIGMAGVVGGLEVLGEFIFCTDEENKLLNTQGVDYNYMSSILRGVRPPNVERLNVR